MSKAIMPAEWAPQDWLWIGFPHLEKEWPGFLEAAQEQIAAFANAVAENGQQVSLLVRNEANEARAQSLVSEAVTLERRVYGDIWLRDTGPLVLLEGTARVARRFGFNGWGGKYEMPGDESVGLELARDAGLATEVSPMILEGGAIDGDGTGLAVTTEQCLLNPNRNPGMARAQIEAELAKRLGVTRLVWFGEGLVNDHTDGHVDNLARFVAPGRLVVPEASARDDPNTAIYEDAAVRALAAGLDVVRIPSPGRIERAGLVEPASYANFAITSNLIVVPTFGSPQDEAGVAAIAALFPDRATAGFRADAVLAGGGGFHCASQQMPSSSGGKLTTP
ncbi:MAG: agmatine deiminase family protein [Pseudomonadota bacterium]